MNQDLDSDGPEPSDWDKYASEEYEILVAEETANEQLREGWATAIFNERHHIDNQYVCREWHSTFAFSDLLMTITSLMSSQSPLTLEIKWISWSYLIYRHKPLLSSPRLGVHRRHERITTTPCFPLFSEKGETVFFLHFITDIWCVCVCACVQ